MIETDVIKEIVELIKNTDNILIGAGAGLSTAAGYDYGGRKFEENFSDFKEKYGILDMYSGGFYPFKTPEEKWAWWSRMIQVSRFDPPEKPVYSELYKIVKDKNYFVITTNVDHQFQNAGFSKSRLFYTQGDMGLWQCSVPCHDKTYDNEKIVKQMLREQKDMKIPSELVPTCPVCGAEMEMNLRADNTFVQDEGWYAACERYENYMEKYGDKRIILFDLGIGGNTPGIIKYPFWRLTAQNKNAIYICINKGEAIAPESILDRSILIDGDLAEVVNQLYKAWKN